MTVQRVRRWGSYENCYVVIAEQLGTLPRAICSHDQEVAMVSQPVPYLTPAEYLALEREAETRSEYHDGELVAMVGASRVHNLITVNCSREVSAQLKGRPCETYANDMRVSVPAVNRYFYPDIVVVCGEPQFEDSSVDTLLNPTVIIEVLSDSTERFDRGRKFAYYRTLPSLRGYLLIAQDEYRVDAYRKGDDGRWLLEDAQGRDATLPLGIEGCTLVLGDVYDRIALPE
jgi:Uma2 family endonuclease